MSDKLIEAFLQMHNKKQIDEAGVVNLQKAKTSPNLLSGTKQTSAITAREPTEAPSSMGTKIKQGLGAVDAGVRRFAQGLGGDYVAAAGDYAVKNVGSALGLSKGTTYSKELEQEKEKSTRAELNYPIATKVGDIADTASTVAGLAGLGKGIIKYGAKKLAGSATDDVAKTAAKSIDGEVTTAMPRPGYKDITPSPSTSVAKTATDVKPAAPSAGPSTSLSRPNSSSVGPATRSVKDVPPKLAGPSVARALPSASDTSKALGGFGKVPMGKVAGVGAAIGAGIGAATLGSKPAGEASAKTAAETPKPESYKVSKGDTLSDLAKKWNVSVADIAKANQGIKDVHKIGIGQELVKPKSTGNPIYQHGIGTKSGPSQSQNIQKPKLKAESTEMTNKLIDAFMHLHSTNSSNLFAEAKKAKKDYDKDGKVESEKDEVWGSRFKAAKEAGKLKEAASVKVDPYSDGMTPREMGLPPPGTAKKVKPGNSVVTQTGKNTSSVTKSTNEEVEDIDEGKTEYTVVGLDKDNAAVTAGRATSSRKQAIKLARPGKGDSVEKWKVMTADKGGHVKKIRSTKSKLLAKEEVEFSEAELAHITAILEANPIAPVPDDYSGAAGGVSKHDISDETVAEEEMKRGRGRPKGSKSGSKHGASGDGGVETKNLASQIRFSRPSGGNFMLKHPTTGVTKAVPAKAATEFYNKYTASEKPAQKQAHHDEFLAKHFGSSEKPKSGISLPKIPGPKR